MKQKLLYLYFAAFLCVPFASCVNGNGGQSETGEDSLSTCVDSVIVETDSVEIQGIVVDEMMSTVTLATEDGDTITYIKGGEYDSDAAIGDEVHATLQKNNDEMEIVNVRQI